MARPGIGVEGVTQLAGDLTNQRVLTFGQRIEFFLRGFNLQILINVEADKACAKAFDQLLKALKTAEAESAVDAEFEQIAIGALPKQVGQLGFQRVEVFVVRELKVFQRVPADTAGFVRDDLNGLTVCSGLNDADMTRLVRLAPGKAVLFVGAAEPYFGAYFFDCWSSSRPTPQELNWY